MKKNKIAIILIILLIVFSFACILCGVIRALDQKILKEEYQAEAYHEAFTINTVNDVNVNNYYYDNNLSQNTFDVVINNNLPIEKAFDLIVIGDSTFSTKINNQYYQTLEDPNTIGKYLTNSVDDEIFNSNVVLTNYSLNANQSITISLKANTSVNTKFVVVSSSEFNRYINNELDFISLNNEYRHNAITNDITIKDLSIIYSVVEVNETNYQNYFLKTIENKYVIGTSTHVTALKNDGTFANKSINEYNESFTYFEKQFVYQNVYDENCFKQVFLLKDITIENNNTVINYPNNIHLLFSHLNLTVDLGIKHYYKGYFHIDTISGKINNDNANISIYTPEGDYTLNEGSLLTNSNNYQSITNVDLTNSDNINNLLDDAYHLIDTTLLTNNLYGTAITSNLNLPNHFYLTDITYSYSFYETTLEENNYVKNSTISSAVTKNKKINKTNDTQIVCLETTVSYQETTKVFDKIILISGNSLVSRIDLYGKELEYYLKTRYDNRIIKGAYIGNYQEEASLHHKYFTSEETVNYSVTSGLSLRDRYQNDTLYGQYLDLVSLQDGIETLTITVNDLTYAIELNTSGISTISKTEHISRYINSFVLTQSTLIKDLPSVNHEGIAFTKAREIEYTLWKFNGVTYSEVVPDTLNDGNGFYNVTYDPVNDVNKLNFLKVINLASNEKLLLRTRVCYNSETFNDTEWSNQSFAHERTFYREIINMVSGLGGEGDPAYVGLQFEQYFNEHPEMIYNDGSYSFNTPEIYFQMSIDYELMGITTNQAKVDLDQYFKLIEHNPTEYASSDHSYYCTLEVITDNIPTYNTTIYIKTLITDSPIKFQTGEAYEQVYSFIIPGIYHNTVDDIPDTILYSYLLSIYNDTYQDESDLRKQYLLKDEAEKEINELDLSFNNIQSFCNNNSLEFNNTYEYNLKGLYALSNTKSFIFDNVKINNFYGLIDNNLNDSIIPNNYSITTVKANNCQLNDSILDFNSFKALETLELRNNNLSLLPSVYRNIISIDLSNNLLTDISSIDDYISVETIYLSDNQIKSFESLRKLSTKSLQNVYVENNEPVDENDLAYNLTINGESRKYYGSTGLINYATYLDLYDHEINVYYENRSSSFIIETSLDDTEGYMQDYVKKQSLVVLNSIMYHQFNNTISLPLNIRDIPINLIYVSSLYNQTINNDIRIISPTSSTGVIKIIISVTSSETYEDTTYTYVGYREIYIDLGGITI